MTTIHRNLLLGVGLGMAVAGCATEIPGGNLQAQEEPPDGDPEARFHRVPDAIPGRYIVVLAQDQVQRGVVAPVRERAVELALAYRVEEAQELDGVVNGFVARMS